MANPNPPLENLKPKPWQPGQSGNPAGSSNKQRLTNALIKLIEEKGLEDPFVRAGIAEAMKGNFQFWSYIFDRIDGKMAHKIEAAMDEIKDAQVEDDNGNPIKP